MQVISKNSVVCVEGDCYLHVCLMYIHVSLHGWWEHKEETCNAASGGATCVVQYFHMLPYACTCTCDVVSQSLKS